MTKTELKSAWEAFELESKRIRSLTYDTIVTETSEEQEARIKFLLRPENYHKFYDYYFGVDAGLSDAPTSWFHQLWYDELFKNPLANHQRRAFRGAAKSSQTNVGNTTHLKENGELNFGLLIGRTQDLANNLLALLQVQLEGNERYIKDFGNQVKYGSWADGEFETLDNTHFKALGLNQPFRGLNKDFKRPDFASMDDLEDRKQAKNRELTKENIEKLTGDLGKAGQRGHFRRVMCNNYIVKDGIVDGYAEKYRDSKNFKLFTHNLCDKNFNPTWHERYTKPEVIQIINDTDYYTSQREDFNNPIEEGKLFKSDWIKWDSIHGNKTKWTGVICHWDLSYKKQGDYKACAILGFGYGKIHVLDVFCRKCDLSEAVNWHFDKMMAYNKKGIPVSQYFDATAAQEEVFLPVFKAESERRGYYSYPLPAHVNTDKHMRIEATLTDVLFNGLLIWDKDLKELPDTKNALNQLLSFEKNTKGHDDFPDTLEGAVRIGRSNFSLDGTTGLSGGAIIGKRKRMAF